MWDMWNPEIDEYLALDERTYDYDFDLKHGIWTQKNGQKIKLKDMTLSHLRNTRNHLVHKIPKDEMEAITDNWISAFEKEIAFRESLPPKKASK